MREVDLIGYLPPSTQDCAEIKAVLEAENPEFKLVGKEINRILNNQFIDLADDYGISRLERILKILPDKKDSLEARRTRVKMKWFTTIPYTFIVLKEQLKALCGADGFEAWVDTYTLYVQVGVVANHNYNDVRELLDKVVPSNLVIQLGLKYNQYATLASYTHGYLQPFTQYQLRNEVISNGRPYGKL